MNRGEGLLTPKQFARLCAYIGHEPDSIATVVEVEFELSPDQADDIVAEACDEVRRADDEDQQALDQRAIAEEHGLEASCFDADERAAVAACADATVRCALLAASRFWQAGNLGTQEELMAFVVGAFGLPATLAARIKELVLFTEGRAADWVSA